MNWKTELTQAIRSELESRKAKNPRYSLRTFAKRLELSGAALSQILSGKKKWSLSVERGATLITHLSLPDSEKNRLLVLMGVTISRKRENMRKEDYQILLDWVYPAILSSHELDIPHRAPEKIAARFGLTVGTVNEAITTLVKKGYLRSSNDGKFLEKNPIFWRAGDGPPSSILREHHKNNLALARDAVDLIPSEERQFSSLTFVGNLAQVKELGKEIRAFHERIMSLMDKGKENNEVFRMSMNLFPIRQQKKGST